MSVGQGKANNPLLSSRASYPRTAICKPHQRTHVPSTSLACASQNRNSSTSSPPQGCVDGAFTLWDAALRIAGTSPIGEVGVFHWRLTGAVHDGNNNAARERDSLQMVELQGVCELTNDKMPVGLAFRGCVVGETVAGVSLPFSPHQIDCRRLQYAVSRIVGNPAKHSCRLCEICTK